MVYKHLMRLEDIPISSKNIVIYGCKNHEVIFQLQTFERVELDISRDAIRGKSLVGHVRGGLSYNRIMTAKIAKPYQIHDSTPISTVMANK